MRLLRKFGLGRISTEIVFFFRGGGSALTSASIKNPDVFRGETPVSILNANPFVGCENSVPAEFRQFSIKLRCHRLERRMASLCVAFPMTAKDSIKRGFRNFL